MTSKAFVRAKRPSSYALLSLKQTILDTLLDFNKTGVYSSPLEEVNRTIQAICRLCVHYTGKKPFGSESATPIES